jgi:hypothetical protein
MKQTKRGGGGEEISPQSYTNVERHITAKGHTTAETAAKGTEITQANICDWFELDERDSWISVSVRGRNRCSDITYFIFNSTAYIMTFFIFFL